MARVHSRFSLVSSSDRVSEMAGRLPNSKRVAATPHLLERQFGFGSAFINVDILPFFFSGADVSSCAGCLLDQREEPLPAIRHEYVGEDAPDSDVGLEVFESHELGVSIVRAGG